MGLASRSNRRSSCPAGAVGVPRNSPPSSAEATAAGCWEWLPRGQTEKRNGLPKIAPDTSDATLTNFGGILSRYFQEEQGRGEYCKVEHFAQSHFDYFFAYPADIGYPPRLRSGRRTRTQGLETPFEPVIAFERSAGTVETCAERGRRCGDLDAFRARGSPRDPDPAPLPEAQYNLQGLLDRNLVFTTQPGDNLEFVRAKSIRVRWPGNQKRYVNFDVDGRDTHANVHDLIDDVLGAPLLSVTGCLSWGPRFKRYSLTASSASISRGRPPAIWVIPRKN